MSSERHRTTHMIKVRATGNAVYRLIADASRWPVYFGPTVHVERSPLDGAEERLKIWACANGELKHWSSRRVLDHDRLRIEFRQEVSTPPVASMGGEWVVTPVPGGSRLTLHHEFEAVDDDPAGVDWINRATDRNSETELANIKSLAESEDQRAELTFTFSDEVLVAGSAAAAYAFLYEAAEWPSRLPHVSRLELSEDAPNLQLMSMDTKAADGSVHTTESARVCFPDRRIVYKQLVTPILMTAHTGQWSLVDAPGGVRAVAEHTITVNEAAIPAVLGNGASLGRAREFLRTAIGGNSRATLELAKRFAESGDA